MADRVSKEKRSEMMSAVHSFGNQSTEKRIQDILTSSGISGWRTNAKDLSGKPDLVFDNEKLIIFIDGCFWHGCSKHKHLPRTNTEFWRNKINKNISRDKRVHRKLRYQGWHVLRIWEHDLKKNPAKIIKRVVRKLNEFNY